MKRSTALLLVLGIVAALVGNSTDFFFHTPFYETWDSAANALSVDRAKHFAQLYGPYSRWGFYHPGPALFYVQALGEWIFFDRLHLSPAPYNAQTLFYLFVSVGFFVAALRVFARYLPEGRWRWWFLCAALVAAAWHFTAINALHSYDPVRGPDVFFSLWSAHALVLPFLCLLTAGASVATGEGADLPLLALADGFLLQTHVAQPLFVLPLTALAYAAFLWRHASLEAGSPVDFELSRGWRVFRRWHAGWRKFRGEHLAVGVILGVFAVPVVVDLAGGTHSNLAAIVNHLHTHQGEHKTLNRSWWYFLQFGGYAPYQAGSIEFTKQFDRAGIIAYLRAHAALFGLWVVGLGVVVWALSGAVRRPEAVADDGSVPDRRALDRRPARQRFLAWAAAYLLGVIGLTLKWGTMQDGQMFYYNAWFNFVIYYFGALIALAVACGWGLALCRASPAAQCRWPEALAGAVAVALTCYGRAGELRVSDADSASTLAFHESVRRVLADTAPVGRGPRTPILLDLPPGLWVTVVGVALQMERAHHSFYVSKARELYFGGNHAWKTASPDLIRQQGLQAWHFKYDPPAIPANPGPDHIDGRHVIVLPLLCAPPPPGDRIYVQLTTSIVNPVSPDQARLDFQASNRTRDFDVAGWSEPEPVGTWTDGHQAVVEFRAVPVLQGTGDVEMSLVQVVPLLAPPQRTFQRLCLFLNGEPLGDERSLVGIAESLTFRISTERWNRVAAGMAGIATLTLELPDAMAPPSPSQDHRVLGINLREIRFRVASEPGGAAAVPTPLTPHPN